MNTTSIKFFKVVGQVEVVKRICPNHYLVILRGNKRFNLLIDYVTKFFQGLPQITKGHAVIRVVVGRWTHKLTQITLCKVLTLWEIKTSVCWDEVGKRDY